MQTMKMHQKEPVVIEMLVQKCYYNSYDILSTRGDMLMKKEKGVKVSIKAKLLFISLVPSLVLSCVLTIIASESIRGGMQDEALKGLRAASCSVLDFYDVSVPGEFYMDEGGDVYKGTTPVSGVFDIVDALHKTTGYEYTIFYGDTRVTTSLTDSATGNRLVGTKAADAVIDTVLKKGEEYSDVQVTINGQGYYAYYVPIRQNGEIIGMAFAGLASDETDVYIDSKEMTLFAVSTVTVLIMAAVGIFFALRLSRVLKKAQSFITELSTGNLKVDMEERFTKRSDEVGLMCTELASMKEILGDVIGKVKKSSQVLFQSGTSLEEMANQSSNTTGEIGHAVEDISAGAMSQAEKTEEASVCISDIGNIIIEVVNSADVLTKTAEDMKNASDAAELIIGELSNSNDKTTEAIEKIGHQIHATNDSVQGIRQAIDLITSIAEETNLLSLNASIEAARAGEHGRGFAVVATQIQKLAEESNNSAREIGNIIDVLLRDSEQTVTVMDEVNVIINEQRRKLEETKDKFGILTEDVDHTQNEIEGIRQQADGCDTARVKIVDIIQDLSAISQENAASTQETNASMEELNATLQILADSAKKLLDLSVQLEKDVQFFEI